MIGNLLWSIQEGRDRLLDRWSHLGAPWQAGILAVPTWCLAGALSFGGGFGGTPEASAALAQAVPAPVAGTTSTFRADGEAMVLYARGPDGSWQEVSRLDSEKVPGQFAKLAATSPDRRMVAYVQAEDQLLTNATISIVEVATGEERSLVTIPQGLFPATPVWSPDGSRLAIVRQGPDEALELWTIGIAAGDLTRVPSEGGVPPAVFYGANQTPLVWSEDSDRLSYIVPTAEGQAVRTEVEVASGEVRLAEPVPTGPRPPCEVPIFSQNDPRWSDDQMFSLGDTIGTAGCALTATAMLLNYYGNDRTPADLNACLGAAAEPIYWASAADRECDAGTAAFESYEDFSWERLAQLMTQARPVILGFAGGVTGSHYVVVTAGYGADGGNYSILDPWDGSTWKTIDYYAAKGYTPSWLVVYRGQAPQCVDRRLAPPVQVPDPATAATATGVDGTWQWRNLIEQIGVEVGVDADVLQAVMALTSGGNPSAVGPPRGDAGRAMGLMQVMSRGDEAFWQRAAPNLGRLPSEAEMLDPALNIRAGALKLADYHARGGRWSDWLIAGVGYFDAATPEGQLTGAADDYGTDGWTYYDRLRANVEAIRAFLGRVGVVPPPPTDTRRPSTWASAGTIETIFGGYPYSISQNFGPTDFVLGPGAYDYSAAYGLKAGDHAGTDLSVPFGTPLYAPTTAKVVFAGPWQYFAPQNVQLEFADGTIAIFGHMSQVAVGVGMTVAPTQPLGLSGTAGTGPHLHLEVRTPDPSMPSGQRAVDPMIYFGVGGPAAAFGGSPYSGPAGPAGTGYNWPTAEAINARIETSAASNPGRGSPLSGKGEAFLKLATQYGVNPGVVVATLQRESQLGTDGSILPTAANNFGGITGSGNCGSTWAVDRYFARFCTVEDGIAANFAIFNLSVYRQSDGTMGRIMEIYAPPWDGNDHSAMWRTFTVVATHLNITLTPSTNIYTGATGPAYVPGAPPPSAAPPGAGSAPPTGPPAGVPPLAAAPTPAPPPLMPPTMAPTATPIPGAGTPTAGGDTTATVTATATATGTPATTTVTTTVTATATTTVTATVSATAVVTGTPPTTTPGPATGVTPTATVVIGGSPTAAPPTGGSPTAETPGSGLSRQITPRLGAPGTPEPGATAFATSPATGTVPTGDPVTSGGQGTGVGADGSPAATGTVTADATGTVTTTPETTTLTTAAAISAQLLPDVKIEGPEDWKAYAKPVTFEGAQVIFTADRNAVVSTSVPPGTVFTQDGRYTITTTVISPQVPGGSRQFTTTFFIDSSAPNTQLQVQGVRYAGPAEDLARELAALPSDLGAAAFRQTEPNTPLGGPIVYDGEAIIAFVPTDNLTPITAIVYRVDGGKWRYYSNSGQPHPLSFRQHGCRGVEFYAIDAAGNFEPIQLTTLCVFAEEEQELDLPTPTPVFTPTPTVIPPPPPQPAALTLPSTTPTIALTETPAPTSTPPVAPTGASLPEEPPTPTASPTETPLPSGAPAGIPPSLLPTTTATPEPTETPDPSATVTRTPRPATRTPVPPTATFAPPPPTAVIAGVDPQPQPTQPPAPQPQQPTLVPATVSATMVPATETLVVVTVTTTPVPPTAVVTVTPAPTEPPATGVVSVTTYGIGDQPLPGACYQVIGEDGTPMAPVCDLSDGQNDGFTTIAGVTAGTVAVAQTTAPAGYQTAETKTGIDVPPDGSVEIAFDTPPLPGSLWIDTHEAQREGEVLIPGVCYVLIASTGEQIGPFCDGETVDTDPSERIRLNSVPAGPGTLRQTGAPPIYELAPDTPVFVPPAAEGAVTVHNSLKRGDVNITVTDELGNILAGACFTLTTSFDSSYGVCDNDGGWDGNPEPGKIDLRDMESGDGPATLVQDVAPPGYLPIEPVPVNILPNQPNPVQVKNVGASEVVVYKYDVYAEAPLAGAVFALYQGETEVGPPTETGANGEARFRVKPGDYVARELTPPANYVVPDGDYPFTVEAGGPWYIDILNYRENLEDLAIVTLDPDGSTRLLDACYVVENEVSAGEACDSSDDSLDGVTHVTGIYPMTTEVRQTRSPDGYSLAEEQEFDLSTAIDSAEVTITNQPLATVRVTTKGSDGDFLSSCYDLWGTAGPPSASAGGLVAGSLAAFAQVRPYASGCSSGEDLVAVLNPAVEPGEYCLYMTELVEGYQYIGCTTVTLVPGVNEITVVVEPIQDGAIHVELRDEFGEPLTGDEFCFALKRNDDSLADAGCVANGTLDFGPLPPGGYYLQHTGGPPSGMEPIPITPVTVNPNETANVDLTAHYESFTVVVHVNGPGPGSTPIAAAEVSAGSYVDGVMDAGGTGADGTRTFRLLNRDFPPQEYQNEAFARVDSVPSAWVIPVPNQQTVPSTPGTTQHVYFVAQPAPGTLQIQVTVGGNPAPGWNYNVSQTGGSFFQEGSTADNGFATISGLIAGAQYCVSHDDYNDPGYVNNAPMSACATIVAGQTVTVSFTAGVAPGDLYIQVAGVGETYAAYSTFTVTSAAGSWPVTTDEYGVGELFGVPGGYEYCATPGPPPPPFIDIAPDQACAFVPAYSSATLQFQGSLPTPPTPIPTAETIPASTEFTVDYGNCACPTEPAYPVLH